MWIDPQSKLLSNASFHPSPNFNERPEGVVVDLIVVHNISLPPQEFGGPYIDRFFTNTLDFQLHPWFINIVGMKVSAHCVIYRNGDIIQYVPFDRRAWHAGVSSFLGKENCNDYSVGIELEGADEVPYTGEQYRALTDLILALQKIYPKITMDRIVGHSTIAPGRKTDPGNAFDWALLATMLKGK